MIPLERFHCISLSCGNNMKCTSSRILTPYYFISGAYRRIFGIPGLRLGKYVIIIRRRSVARSHPLHVINCRRNANLRSINFQPHSQFSQPKMISDSDVQSQTIRSFGRRAPGPILLPAELYLVETHNSVIENV